MNVRIIPRLDIKGPNLVKGVHLEGFRVLGKPEHFARHYYESGADELFFMDAVASLYGRNSLLDIVERVSREVFIPLSVGGGLRSVEDIRTVLMAGADKVMINTAALRRPELIEEASRRFGASTIVVGLDVIRQPNGRYEVYTEYGRERTNVDAFSWAIEAAHRGAGELLVTSVDREGTGKGFDVDLVRCIANSVSIPVIASGGGGAPIHVCQVIKEGLADAVAVASLFHYGVLNRKGGELNADFSTEGNTEFLKKGVKYWGFEGSTIAQVKEAVVQGGLSCRLSEAER